jgi:uncharacterized protein with LGFP repeats
VAQGPAAPSASTAASVPTPAPSIENAQTPAAPAPTPSASATAGGNTEPIPHVFETPPPSGNKGASAPRVGTESYSLARSGTINVRIVKVQLADRKAAISDTDATGAVNTASSYWRAMSNGRLSLNAGTPETWNSKATSTQRYPDMMNTISAELGWPVSPNPWTALVVYVSTPTLSDGAYGAGWSYNGTSGRVIMPLPGPSSLTNSVLTHEFGHVFGLMHANALQCTDGAVDVATNSNGSFANSSCSVQEYKDTLDLMGASQTSQPVVSSPIYEFGGFGNGQEILNAGTVAGKSSYTLKAWGGADSNRAVKFTDPVSGEMYYLELRLPVGNDAATAVNGNRGVKIVQSYGAGSLALPPSTVKYYSTFYSGNQTWQPGQTFTTHAGTTVTIDWISDSAAGVTIESISAAAAKAIEIVASTNSFLGSATSGVVCGLRDRGCYQMFQNGAINYAPGIGAFATGGAIRAAWAALAFEDGKLGYPTSNETCGLAKSGCYQAFQNGTIHYAPGIGAFATLGAIRATWGALGFENGNLGYPTTNEICGLANGGCYQMFQYGAINYSPSVGAFATLGGIRATWAALGYENGKLGYPTSNEACGLSNGGCYQMFQKGAINYTPGVGAFATLGAIRAAWGALGFENGKLGYPTGNETCGLLNDGCQQMFQNGAITYAPGIGAFATAGAIRAAWGPLGYENSKLGYPTSNETCGLANSGCYQAFQYGTIHSVPGVGTYATLGAIHATWTALGSENSKLGYPTSNETCGLAKSGCRQAFQNGAVHYAPGVGAYATLGAIRATWTALGSETGKLGYPTNNESCGLAGGGCYQAFQGGTVHYAPGLGAYASWGAIRDTWAALGYENGKLGYPVSNEICGLAKSGCYQAFQGGSIHYAPATGAYATWGAIRTVWAGLGYENGKLGYPTSNETCGLAGGGCIQTFQTGGIAYAPGVGAFATSGAIRATWITLDAENGNLGYPAGNETCGLVSGGCYQAFQNGTIHSAPGVGAYATLGAIRATWGASGYENGKLGYPTSNETCGLAGGGCRQLFQKGTITWSPVQGITVTP